MNARNLLSGIRRSAVVLAVLAGMTLLVLWLSGVFGDKTPPTETPEVVGLKLAPGTPTLVAEEIEVRVQEEAVGSIRAVQEIQIASRILARIKEMHVEAAGQTVEEDSVLVELEDADLRAHLLEAQAAQRSAQETLAQAERELARTRELFEKKIASELDFERDRTAFENATAELERARQTASAAETMLSYAIIRSPIDGTVIDKLRETGDTVAPGEVLMRLYNPARMQLVASVREQLATRLRVGELVEVAVDALDLRCHGTVSEIVPLAAAGSRAFDVKVTGPCPEGVFSGMFGRLLIDLGTRREVRIPTAAIRSFGQIDQVLVVDDGERLLRRFVVLGDRHGDDVTVLSGLSDGERIVADPSMLREGAGR